MHQIMTSFTRDVISPEDVGKISLDVLSLAIRNGRGRDDVRLIPLRDILSSNKRQGVKVKPLPNGKFTYALRNNKRVTAEFDSAMGAQVVAWGENRKANMKNKQAQDASQAKPRQHGSGRNKRTKH